MLESFRTCQKSSLKQYWSQSCYEIWNRDQDVPGCVSTFYGTKGIDCLEKLLSPKKKNYIYLRVPFTYTHELV